MSLVVNNVSYGEVGSLAVGVDMTDATTTSAWATSTSATFGQTTTLTAVVSAVTPATGYPSGTVEFYDGTMDLGPGTLAPGVGDYDLATLVTPPLSLGDHGFSAVYNGDGTFNQSSSTVETVSVTSALGSLALTGSGTAMAGATYSLTLPTTDSGSDTITQWVVNWGDGSTDTLTSPDSMSGDTHIYQSAGDYLIQAVATASDGNSPAMLNNDVAPASEWSFLSPLPPGEGQGEGGAVTSVAVQPDGSIVSVNSGDSGGPLVRFTSSGQPDGTTFDDVSASIATITSVAVQSIPGGFDILAAGSGYSVARFNSDGSLDTTFGNAGIASPSSALATGSAGVGGVGENPQMFVEPDGNIVLAGLEPDTGGGGGADDLVLAEFYANGQPDDSFGTDGIEAYDLGAAASSCDAAYQPGGDIVAVVGLSAGSGSTEVLAFGSSGSLNSSFTGSGSFTTTAIKSDPLVAIQPNGSIDAAGGNGSGDFAIVQYTVSGGSGWTHSSAGTGSVGALAVQPGGRIVAAVDDVIGSTHAWSLYGFTASGSADSTFDGLGAISGLTGSAAALAIEPNGDILLAGQGASDPFFAQYSSGGPAVAVSEPDVAPTDLSVTASPATYSGADTEDGGSISPAQIEGSFTDPGSVQEAHNITIVWGDGSPNTTFTLPAGQTTFDYALPQYVVSGEYTVQVTVADADGSHATYPVSVEVYYANTQPSGLTLSLDDSTVTLGNAVTLSGSFNDPQSNTAHLVTIAWNTGGESLDITTLSLGAGETTFQASPQTYSATGTYTISVTVSGLDGTAATATTSVTVNPAPEQVIGRSLFHAGGRDQFVNCATNHKMRFVNVRTKVFMAYYVVAWFTIDCVGRNGVAVEPATPAITTIGDFYRQLENDRNRLWNSMIKDAGRANGGLSLVAHLSRPSFAPGEKIELKLYLRNVSEVPTNFSYDRYHPSIPVVLLHDEGGNPVKLNGPGIIEINEVFAFSSHVIISMPPGEAFSKSYAVSNYFELKKPGRYSILAAMRGGQGGLVVAKPIEFILKEKAAVTGEGKTPGPCAVPAAACLNVAVGAGDDWSDLLKMAGFEINGRILDCVLSPYSPDAVHLVTSVTCARNTNLRQLGPFDADGNCTVRLGRVPSNYRILIHDSSGQPVPMTRFGRDFFQRQFQEFPCDVQFGSSIGTWLPLDELFCLKSGADYTILAMLPERPGASAGLVSPVIKIRVPQLPVPGLTRPPYGSSELWKKIVARAKIRDPILVLAFDGAPYNLNRIPRITLRNRSGKAFEGDLSTIETTVLVRDSRGEPILPIAVEGDNYDDEIAKAFPAMAEVLEASRRLDTTPFRPIDEGSRPPTEIRTVVAFTKFPHRYPIIPGQPYTIVVAVRTRGDHPAFVTAGPLTYVPRSECDFRDPRDNPVEPHYHYQDSDAAPPVPPTWDSSIRFAGKPFNGLVLTASGGRTGFITVSLANNGKRPIRVRKWDGSSGYDVFVRRSEEKLVRLLLADKALVKSRSGLEIIELKPQGAIDEKIPVADFSDFRTPGDYTVLVRLPMIGDVDAVLTAAPVTIRIDAPPPTENK